MYVSHCWRAEQKLSLLMLLGWSLICHFFGDMDLVSEFGEDAGIIELDAWTVSGRQLILSSILATWTGRLAYLYVSHRKLSSPLQENAGELPHKFPTTLFFRVFVLCILLCLRHGLCPFRASILWFILGCFCNSLFLHPFWNFLLHPAPIILVWPLPKTYIPSSTSVLSKYAIGHFHGQTEMLLALLPLVFSDSIPVILVLPLVLPQFLSGVVSHTECSCWPWKMLLS